MTGRATLLALLCLAACAQPSPSTRRDQQAVAACRQRADAIFEKQNRGQLFFPNQQRDAPFSSSGVPSVTTAGLSQQKEHDDYVASCLRGSAANAQTNPGQPEH